MKAVVATFLTRDAALSVAEVLLQRYGVGRDSLSIGTVAAYREPHDGHPLLAAWVHDDQDASARRLCVDRGGVLQA